MEPVRALVDVVVVPCFWSGDGGWSVGVACVGLVGLFGLLDPCLSDDVDLIFCPGPVGLFIDVIAWWPCILIYYMEGGIVSLLDVARSGLGEWCCWSLLLVW